MSQDQDDDKEKLAQLRRDLTEFIHKVESGFLRDETGQPDYTGHRSTHRAQEARAKDLSKAKASIVKNIVTWAIIGILTVVGSTLAQSYLVPVLSVVK